MEKLFFCILIVHIAAGTIALLSGLGAIIFRNKVKTHKPFGIISFVFGALGVKGNYVNIRRLRKKLVYKNYWLLAHIGGMLGSYIGAITAFVVNNSGIIPLPDIALWLGPAFFIVPLIIFE